MKKAIEVLKIRIDTIDRVLSGYSHPTPESLQALLSERAELQAAINHLKRKVKKDPRVDGLPDHKKELLLWKKYETIPVGGYYDSSVNKWMVFTSAKPYTTDEILFYADPNEIT